MKSKYIIGLVIIIAFVVWGMSSFLSTTVRYVSIDEVAASKGTVQVMGKIDFKAVQYDTKNSQLNFEIIDPTDNTETKRLKIIYSGVVPGNFDQATSVVAKGRYLNGVFQADQLLVKCPSKYQGLQGKA